MKKLLTLRKALTDPAYFGGQLEGDSWGGWRVLLLAIMGETLKRDELAIFTTLTGRLAAPTEPVRQFIGVIGRRGGKTRALSVLAAFLACCVDHRNILAPGERGVLPVLASTKDQAVNAFNFVVGAIEASPALRGLIESKTADTLTLSTGIDISVRTASFRGIRGITAIGIICDETSFWRSDEVSANPDVESIRAAQPALLVTGGPLVSISSPYSRRGFQWAAYNKNFGPEGNPRILVAQAATHVMNPSADMAWIQEQYDEDPASAAAEFGAEFRSDIEAFIDRDIVESCVESGVLEIPPCGKHYFGFVDAAGGSGSGDAMTLAIAHLEGDIAVLDCLRERKPPFSPSAVCEEFAATLKSYGLARVKADRWGSGFVKEAFEEHGIECIQSAKPKSEIYLELLLMLMSGRVRLLDNPRLISQIASLERKTARGGRDSIDHPPRMHDDLANACSGALVGVNFQPPPLTFHVPAVGPSRSVIAAMNFDPATGYGGSPPGGWPIGSPEASSASPATAGGFGHLGWSTKQ